MKRRLLLLDILLLAALIGSGWRLRDKWLEAQKREQVMLHRPIRPLPPPPAAPMPVVAPVPAINYMDVAQKMLFSRDRNPTVVVEVAAPKPMPPLPVLHGVIDLGNGPTAIMSPKKGESHRGFHAGEKIGDFKLIAVTQQEIELEWEGKTLKKKLEELIDRTAAAAPPPASGVQRGVAAPPPRPPAPAAQGNVEGPGAVMAEGLKVCQPGDTSPAGTVKDGYRKVVTRTPFGQACTWQQVK